MIKLKDILKELEYGEKLFADPSYGTSSGRYQDLIKQMYDGETESDTEEEQMLFLKLKDYVRQNIWYNDTTKELDDLLKLKAKFPRMLDPASEVEGNMVYRGTNLPPKKIMELIEGKRGYDSQYLDTKNGKIFNISGILYSRNKSGYISYTTKPKVAIQFAFSNFIDDKSWPVVVGVSYNEIADRALLHPDFAIDLGGYGENEFLVKGNDIPMEELRVYEYDLFLDKFDR
jgi:hypothetical protein